MTNSLPRPIRVMLVNDLQIVLWGLEKLVQSQNPRMELAGSAFDDASAAAIIYETPVDLILIDLDGDIEVDSIAELCSISPARVLALTGSRDFSLHDSAILAGARGVVAKSESIESLLKAIEKVPRRRILDRSRRHQPNLPAPFPTDKARTGNPCPTSCCQPDPTRAANRFRDQQGRRRKRQDDRRTTQYQRKHPTQPSEFDLRQTGDFQPSGALRLRQAEHGHGPAPFLNTTFYPAVTDSCRSGRRVSWASPGPGRTVP